VFLRQPSDEGVGRSSRHRPLERGQVAGEDAQQGGLARSVGADDPDDVTGGDGEVQALEQGSVCVAPCEVLHDEVGTHPTIVGCKG
jgi:hypothetical protein